MIRKRIIRKHFDDEETDFEYKVIENIEVTDDISLLTLVDNYLFLLNSLRNKKSDTEESEHQSNLLIKQRELLLDILAQKKPLENSVIMPLVHRMNLTFEEFLIFAILLIDTALSSNRLIVPKLCREARESANNNIRDILDSIADLEYLNLNDILSIIGCQPVNNNIAILRKMDEFGIIKRKTSTKLKLGGSETYIRLSDELISLFESRQEDNDSDDEQFAYINKENLRNEKILLDVPTVSAIFSLIEKYKNIKDSDIEQPKIVLYGKDKYLSKIVTHLIALEYDTNILIQRLTEEDDVPFFLRTRRNKRLVGCKITNKTYKLALLSHSILLIDCQSNSHLKSLITSLETKGTNFKFYGLPILIHLCSDEISDIKESEILSQNLKLFKIDGLDKPTASKYLCHLLGINNPLQCDIFEEGNIKLGDIELIAKIAKQKATLNSVPIDDKILKESKDIVYKANESDSKMNITEDEDDEFLDKSRIVAETIKNITISNVVLNQKEQEIVNDIILSIKNRERLYSEILDNKVSYGKGIKILFYGPPGTGKTMTAKAIAGETNIPIISVRLEQLFNKYVGETEKNIRKYFNAAQNQNSILFIDECDSIIMSRDNLNRSFEFSFATTFLKEVENYEGILILSTNYEILRDRALNRRIHFFVKFENPTYEKRILLLKKIIPEKYINNINLETIAQLPFNGGHLKNAWIKAGIEILKGNNITTEFFTSAIIKEIEKEESDVTKKAGF